MLADFSAKLANALLILMLSNFSGISAMGTYSIAHNFFSLGLLFSYWGLGNLLIREVSKEKNNVNKYLSNFAIIRIIFAIIIILAINIIAPNLNYSEQTLQTIQIISLSILASTLTNLIFSLFIAFEEIKYLSIISLIASLFRLSFSFAALKLGGSIIAIAILYTFVEYLTLLISLTFVSKIGKDFLPLFDLQFSLKQIIRAFPFFLIALLVVMDSRMEILIISFYLNEIEVGYFTAMNTIIGGISLFSEGLRNAIFPIFARYQKISPTNLKQLNLILGKYIALVTFPVAISGFFFAGKLVSILFGSQYGISASLLQIAIWTFISYSFTVVAIRLLMVNGQENRVVLSLLISGTLSIILNFVLVPRNGIISVAFVRLITSYLLTFLCLFFTHKLGYPPIQFSVLIKIIMVSIILFLFIFFLKQIGLIIAIISGNLIYLLLVWVLHIISNKDIQLWKGVLRGIFEVSPARKQ
jgi:stage V sporulation protein B